MKIGRLLLVLVPFAIVPAGLGARSMSEPTEKASATPPVEEGEAAIVDGLRVHARFEGKLGPTLQVRLTGFNPSKAQITTAVQVEVVETEPGDPDSRMGSIPITRGSQTVAVEVAPGGQLDRVLTFRVKGLSAKRAARLAKAGMLSVEVSEASEQS
jgi:hypothetical protein